MVSSSSDPYNARRHFCSISSSSVTKSSAKQQSPVPSRSLAFDKSDQSFASNGKGKVTSSYHHSGLRKLSAVRRCSTKLLSPSSSLLKSSTLSKSFNGKSINSPIPIGTTLPTTKTSLLSTLTSFSSLNNIYCYSYYSLLTFMLILSSFTISSTSALPSVNSTSQEPVIVSPGDEAYIECTVTNLDENTVLWKSINPVKESDNGILLTAGKVRVTSDPRFSVIHRPDGNLWILKIEKVYPSDSGIYVCEVNSEPRVRVARLLNVSPFDGSTSATSSGSSGNTTASPGRSFADVDHNYTDCCIEEGVPSMCHGFCQFRGLISNRDPPQVIHRCISFLPSIAKCLADGRNHMPCCKRQSIPSVCQPVCVGNFTLTTVTDHFACMDYAAPLLACIAEGVLTLPPQPKEVSAEPASPTEILIKWSKPSAKQQTLVDWYQINITQLHSFDELGVTESASNDGSTSDADSTSSPPPPLYGLRITTKINGTLDEFKATNLKPFTMYEITMLAINKFGTSLPSATVRTLTLSPAKSKDKEPSKPARPAPELPDIKKCCVDNGLVLDRCVDILCDPVRADEATITDIMICAPWANITFKCMASGIDHTDCCRERGVSSTCLPFCEGTVKRLDFRHFVCLDHMSSYSNCILDFHGVLSSPPSDFAVASVHHDWAVLKWSPPKRLGETILKYNIHWRESSKDEVTNYNVSIAKSSPYLLDGLKPGSRYEVYVSAENKYGASRGSSRVIFSTPPIEEPEPEEEIPKAYNETACCARAGMKSSCLPLCNYQMKVSDVLALAPTCTESISTLVRCGAGGRNHIPCCRRRGVALGCLNLCAGLVDAPPLLLASRCAEDLGSIIQCMEEGSEIIPPMPTDFHTVSVNRTSVHVAWDMTPEHKMDHLKYQVRYVKTDMAAPLHPLEHTSSVNITGTTETIIKGLEPDSVYSMYVVALNDFGISLPSLVLLINTTDETHPGASGLPKSATVGPPHDIEVLLQTVDSLTFKWLPPLYIQPDRTVSYIVYYRAVNGTEVELLPKATEKWIRVETNYNSMIITNLTYNTQYAIGIQSKTDRNETSALSEIVLVWTDPAIPASVNLPLIIPAGPVVEGTNITILCVAMGTPMPVLSLYVNGQLKRREERRHISFQLANVDRNLSSIGCYAANGFGKDAQSAQSTIQVLVRFKPKAVATPSSASAYESGTAKLQCEVMGNPQPRVYWYRESKNHVQVIQDANTVFIQTPHIMQPFTWISTLLIKHSSKAHAGNYLCSAENDYGQSQATISLQINDSKPNATSALACCKEQGVSKECLPACTFDVDIESAKKIPQCIFDLDKLMACAADGSDHRQCCKRKNVPLACLRWCAGLRVPAPWPCLISSSTDIVSCFEEGKVLLPGPPRDVRVQKVIDSNRVIVKWDEPEKNPELVQYYRILWRPIGSRDLIRNQTTQPFFELEGLDSTKMYEFVVKAGNHHGLSVFTDPVVISMRESVEASIGNRLLKIFFSFALFAVFMVLLIGGILYGYKNHYLKRKPSGSGVSFENPSYMKDGGTVQIHDNGNNSHVNGNGTMVDNNRNKSQIETPS
ncbi:Ig-like and fibronectin type-III domain-containing protein 1 [Tetranychus urticae]|uniref:Ig-like and fibronectin type-III domain-containing protein C25G4.10 n=1 Tax=Tetranychus urticae TaxID=32264 RepID=T1KU72_TETUR|nr:Ig-like and fibronectin type-III domain-containing protein 1 [Tetranychus urticae]